MRFTEGCRSPSRFKADTDQCRGAVVWRPGRPSPVVKALARAEPMALGVYGHTRHHPAVWVKGLLMHRHRQPHGVRCPGIVWPPGHQGQGRIHGLHHGQPKGQAAGAPPGPERPQVGFGTPRPEDQGPLPALGRQKSVKPLGQVERRLRMVRWRHGLPCLQGFSPQGRLDGDNFSFRQRHIFRF